MEGEADVNESWRRILSDLRGHTLSSPVRLAVSLILLARGKVEFNELRRALNVPPGTLWSHLVKMKERGLIVMRKRPGPQGPRLLISMTGKGEEELLKYLGAIRDLIERFGFDKRVESGEKT